MLHHQAIQLPMFQRNAVPSECWSSVTCDAVSYFRITDSLAQSCNTSAHRRRNSDSSVCWLLFNSRRS